MMYSSVVLNGCSFLSNVTNVAALERSYCALLPLWIALPTFRCAIPGCSLWSFGVSVLMHLMTLLTSNVIYTVCVANLSLFSSRQKPMSLDAFVCIQFGFTLANDIGRIQCIPSENVMQIVLKFCVNSPSSWGGPVRCWYQCQILKRLWPVFAVLAPIDSLIIFNVQFIVAEWFLTSNWHVL